MINPCEEIPSCWAYSSKGEARAFLNGALTESTH